MKKLLSIFGIVTLLLSITLPMITLAAPSTNSRNPRKPPVTTPPPATSIPWGAYTGNNDQTMASFEAYVGKPMQTNAMFWGWDSDFPQTSTGSQGKKLLIFWEPAFGYDQINNGSQDAYITRFALGAKAYGYPVILAPFDEFNLNEAPWGVGVGTNTKEGFIAAWQRTRTIFSANNVANVSFALAYNNVSIPAATYASFYPGNNYVDYIGVDGFNSGMQTFGQVFASAITEAKTLGKPVWLTSIGSIDPESQFILDLGAAGYPWIWFNKSPFDIDSNSLAAFKSIIQ